jgi:hypothetical protein
MLCRDGTERGGKMWLRVVEEHPSVCVLWDDVDRDSAPDASSRVKGAADPASCGNMFVDEEPEQMAA